MTGLSWIPLSWLAMLHCATGKLLVGSTATIAFKFLLKAEPADHTGILWLMNLTGSQRTLLCCAKCVTVRAYHLELRRHVWDVGYGLCRGDWHYRLFLLKAKASRCIRINRSLLLLGKLLLLVSLSGRCLLLVTVFRSLGDAEESVSGASNHVSLEALWSRCHVLIALKLRCLLMWPVVKLIAFNQVTLGQTWPTKVLKIQNWAKRLWHLLLRDKVFLHFYLRVARSSHCRVGGYLRPLSAEVELG